MDAAGVQAYLHEHIPLSRHMQVRVAACDAAGVRLSAPLEPNINHRGTLFGGSVSALAMLAGWALVHARLAGGPAARLVIRRNRVDYDRPVDGDAEAWCPAPDAAAWAAFDADLAARGRARVELQARVIRAGEADTAPAATFTGTYVALRP